MLHTKISGWYIKIFGLKAEPENYGKWGICLRRRSEAATKINGPCHLTRLRGRIPFEARDLELQLSRLS